jgi:hypothetical protein
LFALLVDTVRQCLELEIRIDEELRRLEAALFVAGEPDAPRGGQMEEEDAPRDATRDRVGAMVEAVIDEEAKTRQEARELYASLRRRLDEDEACPDLAGRPDAVRAASLCRDLDLHPNPSRWSPPRPG